MGGISVTLVESAQDAYDFINWLDNRRPVLAIDTETTGVHWPTARLRLVQFGDAHTSYAIPWETWGGVAIEALDKYQEEIVLHNHKYDAHIFRNHGIKLPTSKRNCTMLMSHLDNPHRSHGLKALAAVNYPGMAQPEYDLKQKMKKNNWTWANIPVHTPEYWQYGGIDTIITARLYEKFRPRINELLYDIEMSSQFAIEEMERKGLRLDIDYLEDSSDALQKFITQTREWAKKEYGIDIRKTAQLQGKLLELGWEPTAYTPTGRISTSKKSLENCDLPLAKAYTDMQRAVKFNSTFFQGLLKYAVDDIIYPNIHPTGATTGRMSAKQPNLQQIPRDSSVRGAFIAREGKKLAFIDYDLMEFVVYAFYADDEGMKKAAEAEDTHTEMAKLLFQTEEISKDQRQLAKSATYAILYGSGAETMSDTAGLDVSYGQELYATYKKAFPGIDGFADRVYRDSYGIGSGYKEIVNINGRKQQNRDVWKLVNYLVQGTCADILKTTLANMWQTDLVQYLRLAIHDELVLECDEKEVDELTRETVRHMEDAWRHSPKLYASAGVYDCWGDKYK